MDATPKTRICTICKKKKDLEKDFRRQSNGKYGKQSACKPCVKEALKVYRQTPKGKAKHKEYARRHREKPGYAARHRSYRDQPKYIWNTYRAGAEKRGLVFELTIEHFEQLFWKKPCGYCGEPHQTAGVDRVDNSLGYTLANVVPCCGVCNFMKLQMSRTEFLAKCEQIVRHQGATP